MKLRRRASLLRITIIVVLTLAAVGTAALHADSYRVRRYPLTTEQRQMMSCGQYQAPEALRIPGLRLRRYVSDWMMFSLWAHSGHLAVAYNSTVEADTHVSNTEIGAAGFEYESGMRYWPRPDGTYANYKERGITVPLSAMCILFAAYPTIAFIRGPLRRYRRRKRGLCETCGYDLRGNESGVCSECGQEIATP